MPSESLSMLCSLSNTYLWFGSLCTVTLLAKHVCAGDIWKWEDELGKCLSCADGSSHAAITLSGHMVESNPNWLQRYRCSPQTGRQTGNLKADRLNDALTDRLTVRQAGRSSFFPWWSMSLSKRSWPACERLFYCSSIITLRVVSLGWARGSVRLTH